LLLRKQIKGAQVQTGPSGHEPARFYRAQLNKFDLIAGAEGLLRSGFPFVWLVNQITVYQHKNSFHSPFSPSTITYHHSIM
jgi:hypothetical protein